MYTPKFLRAYKSSGSNLSISTWLKCVGRKLPQFNHNAEIFNPIPIQIKLAGSLNATDGSVIMSISTMDEEWYSKLVEIIEDMTNQTHLEIVNYLGTPISSMTPTQLMLAGECDVIDVSKNIVRIPKIVEPPLHMSTNKIAQLKEWWADNQEDLSKDIAGELQGLTMSEIANCTKVDGPIQDKIETYLESNTLYGMTLEKFLKTFSNSPVVTTTVEGMSKKILDAVRRSLVANEKQVRDFNATNGSESVLWKKQNTGTKYKDDFSLYREIVEDAIFHPGVGQQLINAILYGSAPVERHYKKKKKKKKRSGRYISNPLELYYKQHYNVYGKLPGHVIEEYNKASSAPKTEYTGDPINAIKMFNLFSGRATIDCGCKKGKKDKKDKKKEIRSELPRFIPLESKMPKLIPINSEIPVVGRKMPKLIPLDSDKHMLVPSDRELSQPLWVDDCPNLEDFLK